MLSIFLGILAQGRGTCVLKVKMVDRITVGQAQLVTKF
jgi:hypothetical protein